MPTATKTKPKKNTKKSKSTKKAAPVGKTYVSFILDESGSMFSVIDASISSFNEYLGDLQRDDENDLLMTLTKFNTQSHVVYAGKPVADVDELDTTTYTPGGGTALYDAIGQTIRAIESDIKDDDAALVVILTDGGENSSREWNKDAITNLIQSKDAEDNWTFVYLGANQDSWAVAGGLGFTRDNVMNYESTSHGHTAAVKTLASATLAYTDDRRLRGTKKSEKFFK